MPFDRSKLENDAREITTAVDRGDLLTLSDIARMTGISKQTISVHISRGKLPVLRVGIDNYAFTADVAKVYHDAEGEGIGEYQAGHWATWWAANKRKSRGR